MPDSTISGATSDLIDRIRQIVGDRGLVTDGDALEPHLVDWRRYYHGAVPFMVRPATVEETAAVVRACADAGVAMVPQGGNTGLVGGSIPDDSGRQVLIQLGRLNRIREIDGANHTITVDAGCILADIQRVAAEADLMFPLSLGAEGSCMIGGNLSTNAGGIAVLRYGNSRDLVLGLEVVLADGRVWRDMRGLRKDNTGYDLKQLFIGAEGSLGIITAAVLKLFPKPVASETAFVAVESLDAAMTLFAEARKRSGDQLVAFELIPRIGIDLALAHVAGSVDPLDQPSQHYVLMQVASSQPAADLRGAVEAILEHAFEAGLVTDGTIASNEEQTRALWFLREAIVEGQRLHGVSAKHDVSVKVSRMAAFIETANARVREAFPGDWVVAFGHVGDGNVHFNVCASDPAEAEVFEARRPAINDLVHTVVAEFDGSISAEHGIGRLKPAALRAARDPLDLELMRRVKRALDPRNLMNPNVLFESDDRGSG